MTDDPVIESAAAIVPVRDITQSVVFYTEVLSFAAPFVADDRSFAIVARGGAAIHLLATEDEAALRATATNIAIYIWVSGLEDLWRELKPELKALPEGRVRAPFRQDYGVREFHVKDPDGCLLFFAERE